MYSQRGFCCFDYRLPASSPSAKKDCVASSFYMKWAVTPKKLSHNESGKDNGRVHWEGETEGARMIQAHQRRIHPCTPAEFHYEDLGFVSVATKKKKVCSAC